MFVEHEKRPQGEPGISRESVQPMNLSGAIREGCLRSAPTLEDETAWIRRLDDGGCRACVLGAAFLSLRGRGALYVGLEDKLSDHFGVPLKTVRRIHVAYENEGWTREQCADWLESQGY